MVTTSAMEVEESRRERSEMVTTSTREVEESGRERSEMATNLDAIMDQRLAATLERLNDPMWACLPIEPIDEGVNLLQFSIFKPQEQPQQQVRDVKESKANLPSFASLAADAANATTMPDNKASTAQSTLWSSSAKDSYFNKPSAAPPSRKRSLYHAKLSDTDTEDDSDIEDEDALEQAHPSPRKKVPRTASDASNYGEDE